MTIMRAIALVMRFFPPASRCDRSCDPADLRLGCRRVRRRSRLRASGAATGHALYGRDFARRGRFSRRPDSTHRLGSRISRARGGPCSAPMPSTNSSRRRWITTAPWRHPWPRSHRPRGRVESLRCLIGCLSSQIGLGRSPSTASFSSPRERTTRRGVPAFRSRSPRGG